MGDIGIIVNSENIRDIAIKASYTSSKRIEVVSAHSFDESVQRAKDMESAGFRVLISRGGHSARIREAGLQIPIIDIPFMGNDIAALLIKAKSSHGEFGVVGHELLINTAKELEGAIGSGIHYFPVYKWKDYEETIEKARSIGLRAIVGGYDATGFAKAVGLDCFCIETREFEIRTAIQEAEKILAIIDKEKRWNELFLTILDSIGEGIISVAADGTVTHLNRIARKLLGIDGKLLLSQPVGISWLREKIENTLKFGASSCNDLHEIDNKYTSSILPIKVGNKTEGAVVVLQEVEYVQQVEQQIRRKLAQKGLVARNTFDQILGQSNLLQASIQMAKQYSPVDSTVLIYGESGTGKEMFAQSIHNYSLRRDMAFVAINCATIPSNLLESELFGYVDGAFTGAKKGGKIGLFELAHNGTIFLDEISEIALDLQPRLLRVLEERQIWRVGDDKVIPVNIRIIAATNKNLGKLVKEGLFREDLYYRLDVLSLKLPPLRERREDIETMISFFANCFSHAHNKGGMNISPMGMKALVEYAWPGNVRELKNVIERLVIVAQGNSIGIEEISRVLGGISSGFKSEEKGENLVQQTPASVHLENGNLLSSRENELISQVLDETRGNKTEAAKKLGISRATLHRKLREMNKDSCK